jgi:hypothetical protein
MATFGDSADARVNQQSILFTTTACPTYQRVLLLPLTSCRLAGPPIFLSMLFPFFSLPVPPISIIGLALPISFFIAVFQPQVCFFPSFRIFSSRRYGAYSFHSRRRSSQVRVFPGIQICCQQHSQVQCYVNVEDIMTTEQTKLRYERRP